MKNYFYLILTIFLLLFTACNNEEPIETTELNVSSVTVKKTPLIIPQEKPKPIKKTIPIIPKEYQFIFKDLEQHSTTLKIKNDVYRFSNIKQPIVMVSLFATWCPPCRGQIPHLSNLQKKFKNNLFILSALVHDDCSNEKLKKFTIAQKVMFFISNNQKENLKFAEMITPKLGLTKDFPLPLMILFVNGKYFTHYEGIMPEEMIESDIQQVLKKIKK